MNSPVQQKPRGKIAKEKQQTTGEFAAYAGLFVIRVRRCTTWPPGEEIKVSMLPSFVDSNVTEILSPWRACLSHKKASVFGAQIARVLGLRHLTPKLFGAELVQLAIMQFMVSSKVARFTSQKRRN